MEKEISRLYQNVYRIDSISHGGLLIKANVHESIGAAREAARQNEKAHPDEKYAYTIGIEQFTKLDLL